MIDTRRASLVLASLLAVTATVLPDDALAQERRFRRLPRGLAQQMQPVAKPMLAVVGLQEQRITIYDSTGARMLDSPVSSGTTAYETPPGVFSIVQKVIDHTSNLYDDASMPFMQRLTWTGIALHAGALPGYPASHGCVRLPYAFAERIFDETSIGMRVVVAREGIAPVSIAAPDFFKGGPAAPRAGSASVFAVSSPGTAGDGATGTTAPTLLALRTRAIDLSRAASDAEFRASDARAEAARAKAAARPAERAVKHAEAAVARIEADLKAAEAMIERGGPAKRIAAAEKIKADAPARIEAARAKLEKVRADSKAKLDVAEQAVQHASAAASAHAKAAEAAALAKQDTSPVSVFISRKTQRLYVRKAFHPLWEGPVFIRDADKPIGTFVFTALEPAEGTSDLRWNVVSLYKNPTAIEPPAPRGRTVKRAPPGPLPVTDAKAAEAALARLDVPADLASRISQVVLPGSSLVISDEPPHLETGKDTDFVVIMSGEPKGGITIREKPVRSYFGDDDEDDRRYRSRRYRGGGGFSFWFD
ncbi:MAG: L,D-transpeptidase family protein [Hyphomicrobiaceae bacterium]